MREIIMLHILILSGIDDIKNYKISNSIILSGWILGLLLRILDGGAKCLIWGIVCMIISIAVTMPAYILGGIGAGDIKLWSVIGTMYGINFFRQMLFYAFIVAGIISLIKLIKEKALVCRLKNLYLYFMYGRKLMSSCYFMEQSDKEHIIPMAPITAVAYFIVLIRGEYL